MTTQRYDIAVVGGGLHGVSIAAEAASRGLSVILLQANDLASGPTGGICSVARGGLRKLEKLRLDWVNRNLRELAQLKQRAPHLLKAQDFHILSKPAVRSDKRVRRGLALFSFLQNRHFNRIKNVSYPKPDTANLHFVEFQLNNSRLILSLAKQAKQLGAEIKPYCRVTDIERKIDHWQIHSHARQKDLNFTVEARLLVNCCGWLAEDFLKKVVKTPTRCKAKVCHSGRFYFPLPENFNNFVYQDPGNSLIYVHRVNQHFLVIGPFYLQSQQEHWRNEALQKALSILRNQHVELTEKDCVHKAWTSRALPEDLLSEDTQHYQDYYLDLNHPGKVAPLLNLFGMSTVHYRLIAERALEILKPFTSADKNPDYETQHFIGGDFPGSFDRYCENIKSNFEPEHHALIQRWIESYGTESDSLLAALKTASLGRYFGHGLYEIELNYLLENEWACCADDILWRRSALGLYFNEQEKQALDSAIIARLNREGNA